MAAGSDRKAQFVSHLSALNTQFAGWVQEQASKHSTEVWSDGVQDYLDHSKKLLSDFKDVLQGDANGDAAPAAAFFSFGGPAAAGGSGGGGAAFGAGGQAAAVSGGFAFGALPNTGGAFGPGTAPAFGGFGGSAANSGGGSLFGAPSSGGGTLAASATNSAAAGAEDDDEDAEEDAGPSVQLGSEGVQILAEQKVKVMSMSPEKKWKDKGAGTLTLRRAQGGSAQPYLVFTTGAGRVLLNAPLPKELKPQLNAKLPTSIIMFLFSSVDGKEERGMHMFKCESKEAQQELLSAINQYV